MRTEFERLTDEIEEARAALNATKWWQPARRAAAERYKAVLLAGALIETRTRRPLPEVPPDAFTADRETPDDGHTFRLVFDIRPSSAVVGEPYSDGPAFMGPAHVIEVRAWNLHDALVKASGLPFAVMMGDLWSHDPLTRPEDPDDEPD